MDNDDVETPVFWSDDVPAGGEAKGGIFYRAVGFAEFIAKCEREVGPVLGVRFSGNNAEVLVQSEAMDVYTS